jgi:hypothetical protein
VMFRDCESRHVIVIARSGATKQSTAPPTSVLDCFAFARNDELKRADLKSSRFNLAS